MKSLNFKMRLLALVCGMIFTAKVSAQQGSVTINHDTNIDVLLNLKKEMNKNENATDRYKIQVYSGSRTEAELTLAKFNSIYSQWHSNIKFEYPNYKVWAGSFGTRLEADRALKEIKPNFSGAFIFKPKK